MQIPDPVAPALDVAVQRLDRAAAAYLAGSQLVEQTELRGATWRPRFDAAVRDLGITWKAGQLALTTARDAVAALGSSDARAVAALERIDAASGVVRRGYDYVGEVLRNLPQPLELRFARLALDRTGSAGRVIFQSLRDASKAVSELAATPPAGR